MSELKRPTNSCDEQETATALPASPAGDLMSGLKEISGFLGLPQNKVFHLANHGNLPGVFKFGAQYHARKSTLVRNIRRLEQGEGL